MKLALIAALIAAAATPAAAWPALSSDRDFMQGVGHMLRAYVVCGDEKYTDAALAEMGPVHDLIVNKPKLA
jgi:hypothetical protein